MDALNDLLAANRRYASTFAKGDLSALPARGLAVLACMDARLDPARVLGLEEGDAHVIRNAGGRATEDAVRSLAISQQLLGTREVVVVHHTGCGMASFRNEELWARLREGLGVDAEGMDFLPFSHPEDALREDVDRLRSSPLLLKGVPISGLLYDVRSGQLSRAV